MHSQSPTPHLTLFFQSNNKQINAYTWKYHTELSKFCLFKFRSKVELYHCNIFPHMHGSGEICEKVTVAPAFHKDSAIHCGLEQLFG